MPRFNILSALSLTGILLLTGCSGEPSSAQMEKAVGNLIRQTIAQTAGMMQAIGRNAPNIRMPEFNGFDSFEKLDCKPVEEKQGGGYMCRFKFASTIAGHAETGTMAARFFQSEQGWQAEMHDKPF